MDAQTHLFYQNCRTMEDILDYIDTEQKRLNTKDELHKLRRENAKLQERADAAHEKIMQLHERIAEMELENDETTERLRRHIIQILFCNDDDREYWQNYYREHLPNEVARFELTQR